MYSHSKYIIAFPQVHIVQLGPIFFLYIGLNNSAPDDMNCTSQLPVSALFNNDVLYQLL